ncbi:chymotrypsinogen A-like [Ornithodoros turicata]|uniref:chymotrypsinogen A-like n=1 Tax=Ornithodoros turicata TaxID=34597 RepID=UPI003139EC82
MSSIPDMMVVAFGCLFVLVIGRSTAQTITCQPMTNVVHHNASRGFIISPGYERSAHYPPSITCSVTIKPPSREQGIRLNFEDMDLETTPYCSNDFLMIKELMGESEIERGTYCSTQIPRPLLSASGNGVRIEFTSSRLRAGRGFKIRFSATNDYTLCPGDYECLDRSCIPVSQLCNGHFNCPDGSDEECGSTIAHVAADGQCGVPVIQPIEAVEDRIVAGEEARPGSWPWQVSLQAAGIEPMGHECGGSLINSEWVVTAQHCTDGTKASEMIVKAGCHDLTAREDTVQTRKVSKIIRHPAYFAHSKDSDISLIKLRTPVNFTDHVQPICLPKNMFSVPAIGSKCYTTGWGLTKGTGHWTRLKQTPVVIMPFESCDTEAIASYGKTRRRSICGTAPNGVAGACSGDSGGPLVCQNQHGTWTLHGVSSLVTTNSVIEALCGMGDHPVWVRVSAFLSWIQDAVRST